MVGIFIRLWDSWRRSLLSVSTLVELSLSKPPNVRSRHRISPANLAVTRWDAAPTVNDASVLMGRPEDVRAGALRLSVLATFVLFSVIPTVALRDLRAPGPAHPHRRLKRGWIWKQMFVPEEDPTPQVIGQVPPQIDVDGLCQGCF